MILASRTWARPVATAALLLLAAFSVAGYFMAGSVQGPAYRTTAWVYLVICGLSIAGLLALLVRGRKPKDVSRLNSRDDG